MKLSTTSLLIPCLLSATANAWDLTVWMKDGRHVTARGTQNSGCVTYDFSMTSPVNKAVFHESLLADTFELYEQAGCIPSVSYKEHDGEHTVAPARIIRSYKVY